LDITGFSEILAEGGKTILGMEKKLRGKNRRGGRSRE